MTALIIERYKEGLSLDEIASLTSTTPEEVLDVIQSKKRTVGRGYSDEFKEIVVERLMAGVLKSQIVREVKINYRGLNNILEEMNVETLGVKEIEKRIFTEIDWNQFNKCPCCKGRIVNDLNYYRRLMGDEDDDELKQKHSYCMECSTEWFRMGGKVYKVNWEYVD